MKTYQLGDKWSPNFDYEGMYQVGANVSDDATVENLKKLHSSFEDVNHHSESAPLWKAIIAKQNGEEGQARERLAEFRKVCTE